MFVKMTVSELPNNRTTYNSFYLISFAKTMERNGYTTITKEIIGLTLSEIWVYAIIKSFTKKIDNKYYSDITYEQVSEYGNINYNTVKRIIPKLINNRALFSHVDKIQVSTNKFRNNYYFTDANNYFYIDNRYLQTYSKNKAFVLLLKAVCKNNTNKCMLNKTEIATATQLNYRTVIKYLTDNEDIKIIDGGYLITNEYIIPDFLITKNDTFEDVRTYNYHTIYKYCIDNNVVPPERDNKILDIITATFCNKDMINFDRIKQLPDKVSLQYFLKVLLNKKSHNEHNNEHGRTIII